MTDWARIGASLPAPRRWRPASTSSPGSGPTLRAAAALKVPVSTLFTPMIARLQAIGLVFVFAAAWWLGRREERRLAAGFVPAGTVVGAAPVEAAATAWGRA